MNLIRAALFIVCAFMGMISLSAQTWGTVAKAKETVQTELFLLAQMPSVPAQPVPGTQQAAMVRQYSSHGCPDCFLKQIKREFLQRTQRKLILGATDVGVAVEEVRTELTAVAVNNPELLATIQQVYIYMDSKF